MIWRTEPWSPAATKVTPLWGGADALLAFTYEEDCSQSQWDTGNPSWAQSYKGMSVQAIRTLKSIYPDHHLALASLGMYLWTVTQAYLLTLRSKPTSSSSAWAPGTVVSLFLWLSCIWTPVLMNCFCPFHSSSLTLHALPLKALYYSVQKSTPKGLKEIC